MVNLVIFPEIFNSLYFQAELPFINLVANDVLLDFKRITHNSIIPANKDHINIITLSLYFKILSLISRILFLFPD